MTNMNLRALPPVSTLTACIATWLMLGAVTEAAAAPAAVPFEGAGLGSALRLAFPQVSQRARLAVVPSNSAPALIAQAVTGCGDDANDFTTLRHAVLTANPGDTINVSGLPCGKITLQNGAITVAVADLTIIGAGPGKFTIDGAGAGRVFKHTGKGTLTLEGMTVTNGVVAADKAYGGCIYDAGNLTLRNVTLTGCKALGQTAAVGGGAVVLGQLALYSSSISGNTADAAVGQAASLSAAGGGVFSLNTDSEHKVVSSTISGNLAHAASGLAEGGGLVGYRVSIKYSTLSGNVAAAQGNKDSYSGGGGAVIAYSLSMGSSTVDDNLADAGGGLFISKSAGFASILQSTISGNTANFIAGGISCGVALSISNSTIAFNDGILYGAGGIFVAGADLTLQSTIVADNLPADVDGANAVIGSHNLIKIPGAYITPPLDTIALDPQLGPLAYNGGATRTHALAAGSPALQGGSLPISLPSDQRNGSYARTVGNATDIGAYEFDPDHIFGDVFDAH